MDEFIWFVDCQDCTYHWAFPGKIAGETFGTKHAIKKQHLVFINGNVLHDGRVILDESDQPSY